MEEQIDSSIEKQKKYCNICNKIIIGGPHNKICCSPKCYLIYRKKWEDNYNKTEKRKQSIKKYYLSEKGKEALSSYRKTPKMKLWHMQYKKTKKYQDYLKSEKCKANTYKYNRSPKRKEIFKKYSKSLTRKKWLQTPIGKLNVTNSRLKRRSIKNNYIEKFNQKEWNEKIKKTDGICPGFLVDPHYVGIEKLTLDHTPSISKANINFKKTGIKTIYTINNINPLCQSCNTRKGNRYN